MRKELVFGMLFYLFPLLPIPARSQSTPSTPAQREAVNLEDASLKELQRRTPLDRIQAIRLLEYRREHGPIRSLYELHYLKGFSRAFVQKLREFAFIPPGKEKAADTSSFLERLKRTEGRFRLRWGRILQKRVGQQKAHYRGPPDALKGQMSLKIPGIASIGAGIEKDPGEPWWDRQARSPMTASGYLKLQERGILRKAVLGGIDAKSGSGLLLDQRGSFLSGKGPSSGALFSIDGHSGSPDRSSLKGLGASFGKAAFKGGFVLSRKKWRARFDTLPDGRTGIKTLYPAGRIRKSQKPTDDEDWLRKDLMGFAGWKGERSSLALSIHHGQASHPPLRSGRIRDHYARNRAKALGSELHYRGHHHRKKWAISAAYERNGGKAFRAAFSIRPHNDIFLVGSLTGGGQGFDPFWSSAARDGRPFLLARLRSERSIAAGWRIALEGEVLHRYWPYYGHKAPGADRSLELKSIWSGKDEKELETELSYKDREKDLQAELDMESLLSKGWRNRVVLKGRKTLEQETKNGFLLLYDLVRSWEERGIKLYWRSAFFDASTYRTRLYAYENDLLYAFSVRPYYRKGLRSYLLLRIDLNGSLTLEGKLGSWIYEKVEKGRIGSGDRAIPGRYKSRFRLQLRGSF